METLREEKAGGKLILKFWFSNRMHTLLEVDDPRSDTHGRCFGYAEYENAALVVQKDLPPRFKGEVVLHELMHAIYANTRNTIPTKKDAIEEYFVSVGSEGLARVLSENPKLHQYIIDLLT